MKRPKTIFYVYAETDETLRQETRIRTSCLPDPSQARSVSSLEEWLWGGWNRIINFAEEPLMLGFTVKRGTMLDRGIVQGFVQKWAIWGERIER